MLSPPLFHSYFTLISLLLHSYSAPIPLLFHSCSTLISLSFQSCCSAAPLSSCVGHAGSRPSGRICCLHDDPSVVPLLFTSWWIKKDPLCSTKGVHVSGLNKITLVCQVLGPSVLSFGGMAERGLPFFCLDCYSYVVHPCSHVCGGSKWPSMICLSPSSLIEPPSFAWFGELAHSPLPLHVFFTSCFVFDAQNKPPKKNKVKKSPCFFISSAL